MNVNLNQPAVVMSQGKYSIRRFPFSNTHGTYYRVQWIGKWGGIEESIRAFKWEGALAILAALKEQDVNHAA